MNFIKFKQLTLLLLLLGCLSENSFAGKLSDNSITLFGKELQFGITSDQFKASFDQFKFDSQEGTNISYSYRTEHDNAFENFGITVKFSENKLVCLEFNGFQTEEYMKIIKATLKQFHFDKTVKEKNEDIGEISSDFYHKEDLKAEYFNFETAVLKICMGN